MKTPNILIIYTGGTIGMKQNHETGALVPFNFEQILEELPALKKFGFNIDTISFNPIIDSSEVQPEFWIRLTQLIFQQYERYDGFVILHGTDTMSYTASAISFMLEDLEKPVIFTGSQLPIGVLRTDGMENLISAIEIAAAQKDGHPLVPEVCIFFDSQLYRGNRTIKYNAEQFRAFRSPNYPVLAQAGVYINFNTSAIHYPASWGKPLKIHTKLDSNVAILKLFPGISPALVHSLLHTEGLRALVLETYGAGNAPTFDWFIRSLHEACNRGLIIVNVSQCQAGEVEMEKYETGLALKNSGVISAYNGTTEATIAKLLFLLGQYIDNQKIKEKITKSYRGEITIY